MFCKKCGNELGDEALFCPECGTNVDDNEKKKKNFTLSTKKAIIVAVSFILIICVCIVIVVVNSVNFSPENVAVAVLTSEYEVDIDTMMKCFPEFTLREIADDCDLPTDASVREISNAVKKDYRFETPQEVKIISVKEIAKFDISEYDLDREEFMTYSEYVSIKKISVVEIDFFVDGERDTVEVTCIKMKGKWYFLRD